MVWNCNHAEPFFIARLSLILQMQLKVIQAVLRFFSVSNGNGNRRPKLHAREKSLPSMLTPMMWRHSGRSKKQFGWRL